MVLTFDVVQVVSFIGKYLRSRVPRRVGTRDESGSFS